MLSVPATTTTDDALRSMIARAQQLRATSLVDERRVTVRHSSRGGVFSDLRLREALAEGWLIDRYEQKDLAHVVVFGLVRAQVQQTQPEEPSELALSAGRFE